MKGFWHGDLGRTIAEADGLASPGASASPHLAAWLRGNDDTAPVSSFAGSHDLPFQRWMKFKEAFSPKFVVNALASMPRPPRRCVDPFGGSGTTALTCSFLGVAAVTIEVNPFLADVIEAKLAPPSAFTLSAEYRGVLARARARETEIGALIAALPASFREPCHDTGGAAEGRPQRFVFWREALVRILALRLAIEFLRGGALKAFAASAARKHPCSGQQRRSEWKGPPLPERLGEETGRRRRRGPPVRRIGTPRRARFGCIRGSRSCERDGSARRQPPSRQRDRTG